jgi:hypothetical protein
VGNTVFPLADTWELAGICLSYITFFWTVASRQEIAPWGVTANLCVRRTATRFHPDFIKTGGGEDIAFCIDTVTRTGLPMLTAPKAEVLHPWWNEGHPDPMHFFKWTQGDGLLPDKYPQYRYSNFPNIVEVTALLLMMYVFFSCSRWRVCGQWRCPWTYSTRWC